MNISTSLSNIPHGRTDRQRSWIGATLRCSARLATRLWRDLATAALLGTLAASAGAAATGCPSSYASGAAPEITNTRLAAQTRELCFSAFGVMHSGVTRTPLWSASHLTRDSVDAARRLPRRNTFHPEGRLPATERANLQDYVRSGFDRGHMFPSGDAPTQEAQHESFTLSNMIPQNPDNNQNLWEGIESAVRTLAREEGDLYVVTGPLFTGSNLQQLNGRVLVPTQIYKVVYSPRRREAAAYLVDNAPGSKYTVVSVAEIERLAGIDFFPSMPASIKRKGMRLPAPTPYSSRHGDQAARAGGFGGAAHNAHGMLPVLLNVARHMTH